ncbi:MAG: DNA (cytosine-5-)-methyltransferase [Metamycoplasmataceae bacterium]
MNQSKKKANNFFDISQTKGIDLPNDLDIFTYSFPCQDISNQGKQKGFSKEHNTRSGLLWEIERIFSEIKKDKKALPKYLLLENVKAMISKNHKANYNAWLKRLKSFGYKSKEYVLNATNFGSCQNRERVFVLSVLEDHAKKINFEFSPLNEIKIENKKPLKDILDLRLKYDDRFNKFNLLKKGLTKNNILKMELENYSNFSSENFVYDINHSGPTLTASGALSRIKLYFGPKKIRSITAKECFKYMGFQEEQYKTIIKHTNITENKLIYLAGNSISVEVLEAIFRTLVF